MGSTGDGDGSTEEMIAVSGETAPLEDTARLAETGRVDTVATLG